MGNDFEGIFNGNWFSIEFIKRGKAVGHYPVEYLEWAKRKILECKEGTEIEAEAVSEIIAKKIKKSGSKPPEIAILVRNNKAADPYLRTLSSRCVL